MNAVFIDGYDHSHVPAELKQLARDSRSGADLPFGRRIAGLALLATQQTTFDEVATPGGGRWNNMGPGVEWMQHATGSPPGSGYCMSGALAFWALADPDFKQKYSGLFTQENSNPDKAFQNAKHLLPPGAVIDVQGNLDKLTPGSIISMRPGIVPHIPFSPHAYIFQGFTDPSKKWMLCVDANAPNWDDPKNRKTSHEGTNVVIRPSEYAYQAILPEKTMPNSPITPTDLSVTVDYYGEAIGLYDRRYERPVVTENAVRMPFPITDVSSAGSNYRGRSLYRGMNNSQPLKPEDDSLKHEGHDWQTSWSLRFQYKPRL